MMEAMTTATTATNEFQTGQPPAGEAPPKGWSEWFDHKPCDPCPIPWAEGGDWEIAGASDNYTPKDGARTYGALWVDHKVRYRYKLSAAPAHKEAEPAPSAPPAVAAAIDDFATNKRMLDNDAAGRKRDAERKRDYDRQHAPRAPGAPRREPHPHAALLIEPDLSGKPRAWGIVA